MPISDPDLHVHRQAPQGDIHQSAPCIRRSFHWTWDPRHLRKHGKRHTNVMGPKPVDISPRHYSTFLLRRLGLARDIEVDEEKNKLSAPGGHVTLAMWPTVEKDSVAIIDHDMPSSSSGGTRRGIHSFLIIALLGPQAKVRNLWKLLQATC